MAKATTKKSEKITAEQIKEIRDYCNKTTCGACNYKELCGKVPGKWTDKEIERVAAG